MLPSPLQLRSSHVVRFSLGANPKFDPASAGLMLGTNVQLGWSQDLRHWGITLKVDVQDSEDGKPSPYHGGVVLLGQFEWIGPLEPWPRLAKLVGVNGASMLFGIARELVLLLSSRGPHGPMMIQTVNFSDFDPGEAPVPDPTAAAAIASPVHPGISSESSTARRSKGTPRARVAKRAPPTKARRGP